MIKARTDIREMETRMEDVAEAQHEIWHHWPVNWTAVWVGALASLAMALIFGLIGIALGAHLLGPDHRLVDLHKMAIGALIFSVCGAFFAFVAGGWVAGKIAGILHSEPAIVHGAIVWLLTVPLLLAMAGLGAGSFFGGWYAGLTGTPSWAGAEAMPFERPDPPLPGASEAERTRYQAQLTEYHDKVKQWKEETPRVTRNSALGAVTALLLGLVGSVLGGWMACGEPMSMTYHLRRRQIVRSPA